MARIDAGYGLKNIMSKEESLSSRESGRVNINL